MSSEIILSHVSKLYAPDVYGVRDLSLTIPPGTFCVLLGTSGCGKTTTLKMINRLIEPSSGTITIGGDDIFAQDPVQLRRKIGYVIQGTGLFPHMTVAKNIAIVPELLGWAQRKIDQRVDELLDLVQLPAADFRERLPAELSGGQRQRVGFARALAANPQTILMDEPFGALDPLTRDSLQDELKSIQASLQLTAVMVTHDISEALRLADQIVVMDKGSIVQKGSAREIINNPATDFVQEMIATPKRQAELLRNIL